MTIITAMLDGMWNMAAGHADLGPVEFSSLKRPASPNYCLVCPEGFCGDFRPNITSPEFNLDVADLRVQFNELVQREPNVVQVVSDNEELQDRYVQRSKILRFPDTITVRFIKLKKDRSTLAIYSRSQIGYSDMGVNKKRMIRWLGLLSQFNAG